jgi:hypothetical protein
VPVAIGRRGEEDFSKVTFVMLLQTVFQVDIFDAEA